MNTYDLYKQYDAMLDEVYGDIEILGLRYAASVALKRIDPIAYGCGFNDYCDAEGIDTDELED